MTAAIDHRALQRALFRVQLDAALAERVLAGDRDARASLGLGALELELLLAVDPDALRADPGGRRKLNLCGNLASEYRATALVAPDGLLEGFLSSPQFHRAIAEDAALAPAFGAYAEERARALGLRPLLALVALERAMAELRRAPARVPGGAADAERGERTAAAPGAGDRLRLAPRARLVRLAEGTLEWASALAEAAAQGRALPRPALGAGEETVLLLAGPARPHALPDVAPERLEPAVARLLAAARDGVDPGRRAALAAELGATPEELEAFAADLVADGVLVRG